MSDAPSPPPLSVHILATSRCNLRCRHCFLCNSDSSHDQPVQGEPHDLSPDIVFQAIRDITRLDPQVDIELEGGEISLHPLFLDLINGLDEDALPNMTVTTNAVRPIPFSDLRLKGRRGPLHLRFSVEGHNERIHAILRPNSLKEVLRQVEQGAASGAYITLRTTLHSSNYRYLADMMHVYADSGAKAIQFVEFQSLGSGAQNAMLAMDDRSFGTALESFIQACLPKGVERMSLNLSRHRLAMFKVYNSLAGQMEAMREAKGGPAFTINWDGTLGCCPWAPFTPLLAPAWPHDFFAFMRRKLQSGELLHSCPHCSAATVVKK